MRLASLLLCATLSSSAYAATHIAPATYDDAATLDTPFTLQRDTQIPGKLLKAGGYTIVIKDHLTDRAIIQVKGDNGKLESTFLGVFHAGMQATGNSGPITLPTDKGPEALRGFKFPGGGTIEFVYPKAEAASIVSKTADPVLAIDPASDNLNIKGSDLSKEDAQIVTLWSLQATRVAPGQPGISAKKYIAPANGGQNFTVASASAPAAPVSPAPATVAARQPVATPRPPVVAKRPAPPAPAQVASNGRRPALAALPHTASSMPLLLLVMLGSFASAVLVRFGRQRVSVR